MVRARLGTAALLGGATAAVLFFSGCAAPSPVERTALVGQERPLEPPNLQVELAPGQKTRLDVDVVYKAPAAPLSAYRCVYVAPPQFRTAVPRELEGQELARTLGYVRRRLHAHLAGIDAFELVTTNEQLAGLMQKRQKVCRLDLAITDVAMGNGLVRYLVGLDQGAVQVQLEGRLIDADTGQVLLEFADRRIDGGNPSFGFGLKVFDGPYLLRKNLGIQTFWLAHLLKHLRQSDDRTAAASQPAASSQPAAATQAAATRPAPATAPRAAGRLPDAIPR